MNAKKFKRLLDQVAATMHPRMWLMNHPYDKEWDQALNRMLDKPNFEARSVYTVTLNGKAIWVSNYPYGYATPYEWAPEVRPSRATIIRLRNALSKHLFEEV